MAEFECPPLQKALQDSHTMVHTGDKGWNRAALTPGSWMLPGEHQDDGGVWPDKSWVEVQGQSSAASGCLSPGKEGAQSVGKGWTQLLLPLVRGWLSDSVPATVTLSS